MSRGRESCDCSSWSWRILRMGMMWYLQKGAKEENQILLRGIQWLDEKKWAQIEIQDIPFKRKGKQNLFSFVHWGWWNTQADFPQTLEAAIYGDVQYLMGRGPGQPAQADPGRGVDPIVSSSPFQPPPSVLLWPLSSLDSSPSVASVLVFFQKLSFGASGHIMSISQERWWGGGRSEATFYLFLIYLMEFKTSTRFSLRYCSLAPFLHRCLVIEC